MNLFKCTVCGFVYEADEALDFCPKCGAPKEKHVVLSEEDANKIYASDESNDLHMELVNLAATMIDLSEAGIEIGLDPGCIDVFEKTIKMAWEIKALAKAELGIHMSKGKW
ncbi:rubredoxin-like domain-containing protein [Petrocella sp. FN5]|uniref:rubredoxin-like domain-containing protein n=1 Tax=Petrocella sp. FN5 TaxID=3032002 RepID=UPI0023DC889D|nr:rubredoxin [Petrocella sp. FN5]MDF1616400.1 rubredoxin [Petrocella sp. FN5]